MAKKEKDATQAASSAKKNDKSLPGLIFLIGLALIVGGVLMQIGYFDTSEKSPTPAASNTSDDQSSTGTEDEGTGGENVDDVDFSQTEIKDNESIAVKQDVEYTYGSSFKMTVTDLQVTCDDSGTCGSNGDKAVVKFVSTAGQEYELTLTPDANTQNLVDVPVSVEEWHDGYVMLLLTR